MVGAAGGDRAALPEIWPPGSSADEAFDDAADLLHAADALYEIESMRCTTTQTTSARRGN